MIYISPLTIQIIFKEFLFYNYILYECRGSLFYRALFINCDNNANNIITTDGEQLAEIFWPTRVSSLARRKKEKAQTHYKWPPISLLYSLADKPWLPPPPPPPPPQFSHPPPRLQPTTLFNSLPNSPSLNSPPYPPPEPTGHIPSSTYPPPPTNPLPRPQSPPPNQPKKPYSLTAELTTVTSLPTSFWVSLFSGYP